MTDYFFPPPPLDDGALLVYPLTCVPFARVYPLTDTVPRPPDEEGDPLDCEDPPLDDGALRV
jgi:hypothetical protein